MAVTELAQTRKLYGLRVLIVEDEALVAIQLVDMLATSAAPSANRVDLALDLLGHECRGKTRLR